MRDAVACVRRLLPQAELQVDANRSGSQVRYDGSVTEAAIGYSPQFTMEEGFRRTINAMRVKHGLPPV
jgi:nucleoside-diphosphate-sugar epimerase